MKKIIAMLVLTFFISNEIQSQSVAINNSGAPPAASTILDVQSNNKGLRIPQVSLVSNSDITTVPFPVISLLLYNTNATMTGGSGTGYYYWDGTR